MKAVSLTSNDLRRHVMWGTNDGIGPKPAFYLELFGCAHIHKCEESIYIHHKIFGFQIAIDDTISMQMLHHEKDLGHKLPSMVGSKRYYLGDNVKEILPLYELHDEVDEVAVLDKFVEGHYEGEARNCPQNLLLVHYILDDL